tara:strand:+ start:177 stop:950 length:774 start_codon:yes stop_codon:yes gene_type:complete
MKVPGILKNKYILYLLLVVAIVNVLGYLAMEDYNSLALFVVMGLLSTYFSKNMSVNLLVAIVVTSVVAINKKVREGFEEQMKEGAGDDVQSQLKKTLDDVGKMADKAGDASKEKEESSDVDCKTDADCPEGKCENNKCASGKKDGFQNNVPPSSPAPVKDDSDDSVGDRIDYAATMEQAYNNLQNMLGKDGMNSITQETKKLVNQQKDLMGTLSQMAPILTNAKETLAGLNLEDMGNMSDMLKTLQGGAPPKMAKKK